MQLHDDDSTEKPLREDVQELYYVGQQLVDTTQPLADQADDGRASQAFSEHYEIAAYGSVTSLAGKLGNEEAADLLQETLREEEEALEELSEAAEQFDQQQAGSD